MNNNDYLIVGSSDEPSALLIERSEVEHEKISYVIESQ